MIRSAVCAGTAALLCMSFIMPAAMADAPLMSVQQSRLSAPAKPDVSKGDAFADVLAAAQNHPNVYTGETWLTELLQEPTLTEKQHARALYARAQHRWKKSSNRIGAWQDFTEFTKRHPSDPYARNAGIEAGYVKIEIDRIEKRMQDLQTLSVWFEDAWLLGKHAEAAGRYQRSGLEPEPQEIEQLHAAGYICLLSTETKVREETRVTLASAEMTWCG